MKALVLTAAKQFEIRDEKEPAIADHEALVRVRACTIGHTDLALYSNGNGTTCAILGREVSGVVEATGRAVTGVKIGDRVLFQPAHGGFAEYCAADASKFITLPESVGFEEGAIAHRMPAIVRGIEKSVARGHTVFISGAGPVGMLCAQVARAHGATRLIVADLYEQRLRRVVNIAADTGINASTEDVARRVREETDGKGADVCIECTGVEASFRNCEAGLKNGGTLVVMGTHPAPVSLDLLDWEARSLNLIMGREQQDETPEMFRKALDLIHVKAVMLRPLLTHVFPFHRASEAFDLLLNDPARAVKIAIVP